MGGKVIIKGPLAGAKIYVIIIWNGEERWQKLMN